MSTMPLSPEVLVPRFGDYLVEKGIITPDDLKLALEHQEKLRAEGQSQLIGQILLDLGIIDNVTREAVITEVSLQLRAALAESNQQLLEANQQLERRVQERTAQLQQAMEKLAELNQLKTNIVANISHELRTPLTHLKGYLELILAGDLGTLNEQQQNALSIMERSSERLGRLIEDLILFSVSERDQMHIHKEPFNLELLCHQSIQKSDIKARERSINLLLECEPSMPLVVGDREKISWVIMQFLDNAIKFTKPNGKVILRTYRDSHHVIVAVFDTGIGIPSSRMDEIFDSFHQLDGSTTRKAGGTGLGLALAKKIIEGHGSVIRVTSEVGKGSCFAFALQTTESKPAASS